MQANSSGHSSSGEEAEAEDQKERDEFMACLTKFMEEKGSWFLSFFLQHVTSSKLYVEET